MIDEQTALAIARAAAASQGWSFSEPAECRLRRNWLGKPQSWDIRTNAGKKGTVAKFTIDATDGQVIEKGYVAR